MLRPIWVKRSLRRTPPSIWGFLEGVTPIDIFKTTHPIDMKFFWGQLFLLTWGQLWV